MFYTLVSRTAITKINSPRDYFYIFLLGSIGYVVLHWFLNMDKREGMVEKVREYLYYAMAIDMMIAFALLWLMPAKPDQKTLDDKESKEHHGADGEANKEYTPEQKNFIRQRMLDARRQQQQRLRQKDLAEQRAHEGQNNDQHKGSDNGQNQDQDQEYEEDQHEDHDQNEEQEKQIPPKNVKRLEQKSAAPESKETKKSIFSKSEDSRDSRDSKKESESEQTQNEGESKPKQVLTKKKKIADRQDTEIPVFEGKKKRVAEAK